MSPARRPRTCCRSAHELEVNLPGTKAAFRAGILNQRKAAIIASATALLDPEEARAAEAMVLGRAGALTPPGLRAAITRAVMEVAPGKAKQRREHEAKKTRVERWAEASGNAGLAGRELPPAQVLAADQRVTAWAKELRKAGVERRDGRAAGPGLPGHLARHGLPAPRRQARRHPTSRRLRNRLRLRARAGRWPG